MIFSRHRFTRTFAEPPATPAAHEAAVIEEELQQAQPGAATVQMAPQAQAVAQPGIWVFNQRAAAWRALHGLRDRSPDAVELAAHGGMQPVSRIGVKAPGMIAVIAPVGSVVKRGFERPQECGFLLDFATAFSPFSGIGLGLRKLSPSMTMR